METQTLNASIETLEGELVIEDVRVTISEWTEHDGEGLDRWEGTFSVPTAGPAPTVGDNYLLRLEDGRAGEMLLSRSSVGGGTTRYRYTAAGPLE